MILAYSPSSRSSASAKIEAKLKEFYLPDITSVMCKCDWELYKCHEPELED